MDDDEEFLKRKKTKIGILLSTADSGLNLPSERINVDGKSTATQLKELLSLEDREDVYFVLLQSKGAVHLTGCLQDVCTTRTVDIAVCTAPQPLVQCEAPVTGLRALQNLAVIGLYIPSASGTKNVQVWDVQTGVSLASGEESLPVRCVDVMETDTGATVMLGCNNGQVSLWRWLSAEKELERKVECIGHDYHISSVAAAPGKCLLASAGLADGTVKIWSASLTDEDLLQETGGIGHQRRHLDRSVSRRPPRVTYKLPQAADGYQYSARCADWIDDGRILVSSQDKWLRVYDMDSGDAEPSVKLQVHGDHSVPAIAVRRPDGLIATGVEASGSPLMIIDLRADQQVIHKLSRTSHHPMSLRWNPWISESFAETGRDALNVWDLRQPKTPVLHLPNDRPPEETGVVNVDWTDKQSVLSSRQEEIRMKQFIM